MKPLHPITSPMQKREGDPTGDGHYGANRGARKHKGLDIVALPGQTIVSAINGAISKIGYPYADALQFRYIDVVGNGHRVRIMYVMPIKGLVVGTRIFEGQPIGHAQDIAKYWGHGMVNHSHIEIYKHGLLTDPEPLFLF